MWISLFESERLSHKFNFPYQIRSRLLLKLIYEMICLKNACHLQEMVEDFFPAGIV